MPADDSGRDRNVEHPGVPLRSNSSAVAVVARARKRTGRRCVSRVAIGAAVVLATATGPAWAADGFSLKLSGPSGGVVGQPIVLTASGANPAPADYPYPTYLDVEAFRPSVVPTCPSTQSAAGGLASGTGGAILAWDVQMNVDASGAFSIPFGFTPGTPGPVLLCGYTAGLAGETLALGSLTLPVRAAGVSAPPTQSAKPPARPNAASIALDARRGIRSCHALLGPKQGRGCVRHVVKRANAACRRLRSLPSRTRCLRAVRTTAKRYS